MWTTKKAIETLNYTISNLEGVIEVLKFDNKVTVLDSEGFKVNRITPNEAINAILKHLNLEFKYTDAKTELVLKDKGESDA